MIFIGHDWKPEDIGDKEREFKKVTFQGLTSSPVDTIRFKKAGMVIDLDHSTFSGEMAEGLTYKSRIMLIIRKPKTTPNLMRSRSRGLE